MADGGWSDAGRAYKLETFATSHKQLVRVLHVQSFFCKCIQLMMGKNEACSVMRDISSSIADCGVAMTRDNKCEV